MTIVFTSRSATRSPRFAIAGLRPAPGLTTRLFWTWLTPEVSCAMAPASRRVSSLGTSPLKLTTPWLVVVVMSNAETFLESSSAVFTLEVVAASCDVSLTDRNISRTGAARGDR